MIFVLFVTLITLHKMYVFLPILFIVFLILYIVRNTRINNLDYNKPIVLNLYLLLITTLFLLVVFDIIVLGRTESANRGFIDINRLEENYGILGEKSAIVTNLVIFYTIAIGLLAIFFPLGFLFTLYSKFRSLHKELILLTFLAGVFVVLDITYFRSFFGIFVAILVATGIFNVNQFPFCFTS